MIENDIASINKLEIESASIVSIVDDALINESIAIILLKFETWLAVSPLKLSTKRVYASRLRQFVRYVKMQGSPTTNYAEDGEFNKLAEEFIAYAAMKYELKPLSVNNFITMFRLIARIAELPDIKLQKRPHYSQEKSVLNQNEQEFYLNAVKFYPSSRDRLLVMLFLKTGIRLGEMVNLRISDLIWENGLQKIRIDGKLWRRTEALDKIVSQVLQDWLTERSKSAVGAKSSFLFPGASGGKITTTAVDMVLRKIGYRVGLNVSARLLRNTYHASLRTSIQKANPAI